jgi:aminopeptidase N
MAVADLARSEARERAELVAVDSYEVELDFTQGAEVFGSTSMIRFTAREVGASTFVDLVAEKVHQAMLNGVPVDLSAHVDGRLTLENLEAENVLTVVADFAYTHESIGVHRSVDQADGKVYLYTTLCPAETRRVYANFDQPDLKAAFVYAVIAPENWVVLSNQPATETTPVREGVARWQFPATPRLSTYVTAVIAGEYTYVQQAFKTQRGQEIPLGLACRASLAEFLEPEDMFLITGQGLDYYTDLFDMDFPFAKYDQILVPEFFAGAMENAACVTFSEDFVFRSKVTAMMYELRAMVILHEMAHMWFGDLVTMRWWGDIWLNESFAEFCGTFVSAEATRFTESWTAFSNSRKTWGYMQDQLPSTHPVVADAPTLNAVLANFDGISYAKGASVLKQLVAHIGQEEFFAGVRAYFGEHAWDNAEFADLLAALELSSGKDLREWSAAWLETAGPNTLRAEFELDDEDRFTAFAIRQEAPAEYPTLRPHHINVGFYDRTDGALTRSHQVEVDVAGELTEVPELVGRSRSDVILLNDDDLGYAITRFDPRSLAVLAESIGTFDRSLPRAISWTAAMDMLRQAELSVPAFVRMLVNGMRSENSVSLLQILHRVAKRTAGEMADPGQLTQSLAELAEAGTELLTAAEPGGDFQLAWAQLLSWSATTDAQLDLVEGLLEGTTVVPGLTVDAELRWALLQRLAVKGRLGEGTLGEGRIEAELARDSTDDGIRQAQRARASLPDAEHKAAAWALLTESQELGVQGIRAVVSGFSEPEHAELLAPYARKYFDFLPVVWDARSEQVRMLLAEQLFPYACAGPELLELAEAFLAGPDVEPPLRRVIVEAVDMVGRILRSRAL